MAQNRIFIETTGEGYLLPVGAELQIFEGTPLRQNTSGLLYTENPAVSMTIRGSAADPSPTRSNSAILEAAQNLTKFLTGNPEIKKVVMFSGDGSDPLGRATASFNGSVIKEYLPAYGPAETAGLRWEVLTYAIEDILPPYSFGFAVSLQNWPMNDIDRSDIGSFRSFDTQSDREIIGGIETHSITISARLPRDGAPGLVLSFINSLMQGGGISANASGQVVPAPQAGAPAGLAVFGVPAGCVVRELTFSYSRVSAMFNATIKAIRPTARANGFTNVLNMSVEATVEPTTGFKVLDRKFLRGKGFVQRATNPSATLTVMLIISSQVSGEAQAADAQRAMELVGTRIAAAIANSADLVPVSAVLSEKTGELSSSNTETANTISVAFTAIINNPSLIDPSLVEGHTASRGGGKFLGGWQLAQFSRIIGAAVLDGLLTSGPETNFGADFQ